MPAFGKDENAISAVDGLAGVGETAAEASFARQWEKIQQRDAENPLHTVVDSQKEISVLRRTAQGLQRFASRRGGNAVAETRRQRGQEKSAVNVADVI